MVPQSSIGKAMNRKVLALGIGTCLAGALLGLFGLFVMAAKLRIAVIFLGARELFGMPMASDDAVKVAVVALVALALIGLGVLLFIVGAIVSLIQFSRRT